MRHFGLICIRSIARVKPLCNADYDTPPPFFRNDTFSTATFSFPSASLRSWYTYSTRTSPWTYSIVSRSIRNGTSASKPVSSRLPGDWGLTHVHQHKTRRRILFFCPPPSAHG